MKAKTTTQVWETVQAECADLAGASGIETRRKRYAPFFLRMGENVVIEEGCRFYHPGRIVIDDDARINFGALVYGSGGVWIGRHVRIGPRFFVHSANHEVGDGPTAFFERGYQYLPTVIGDNVLISANVSIMPGAVLGNSVFVAAGAVVTGGQYRQRARLFGVPASERAPPPAGEVEEAPEIAFLVPETGHWSDAALHLLSTLGLPQVTVRTPADRPPASLHTVILYGPSDWNPALPTDVECWKLGGAKTTLGAGGAGFDTPSGVRIALPDRLETSVVADGREGDDLRIRGLEQTLYWLTTRLAKQAGPLSPEEKAEWDAALGVLQLKYGREDRLRERIDELIKRRTPGKPRKEKPAPVGRRAELVLAAADKSKDRDALLRLTTQRAAAARNAADLIACWIAATVLGDADTARQIGDRLADEQWRRPDVAMPRSVAGGNGFCYSPLVLAWLFLEARREAADFELPQGIGMPRRLVRTLEWRMATANGSLVDQESRTISRSLMENWLAFHQMPCPEGKQVVLEDFNYGQMTAPLEQAWREVFLLIQGRKGRPLVRVRPWPGGRKAAISLRYDVDRPISSQIIETIARSQGALANAPCGSWYYFGGRAASEGQTRQLAWRWQEVATHAEDPEADHVAGLGVTHHSAPTSTYWRGDRTNRTLDDRGATYCEFLNAQTGYPRPAWIGGGGGDAGRLGQTWTTPIHFPLEGSTSDVDLGYFDQRRDRFRALLAAGGHCIVGTHPDLNQDLMEHLLVREDIADVWFATVEAVVKRCRRVLTPGAITCAPEPAGGVALVSRESLADVRIEIHQPGSDTARTLDLQFEAGHPRSLDETGK